MLYLRLMLINHKIIYCMIYNLRARNNAHRTNVVHCRRHERTRFDLRRPSRTHNTI